MENNSKLVKLGKLGSFKNGANYNQTSYGFKYPVVSVKNLYRGRFVTTDELDALKEGVISKIEEYFIQTDDILFARSSVKRSGAGQVAIVGNIPANCIFSGFTIRFRIYRSEDVNPLYLLYLFKSEKYRELFTRIATGTTISNLSQQVLADIDVFLPEKRIQDQIAFHLDCLDRKIELNRQINQTLEQMAQTLFKSWFVDFDPVTDNAIDAGNEIPEALQARAKLRQEVRSSQDFQPLPADVRALFPAEFEDSELGWVPKGWANATLDKLTDILSGFAFKSNDFSDVGNAVIKIKNINSDRTVDIFDVQCIPTSVSLSAGKFKLGDGALIMAMTGATVGKFGLLVTENEEPYFLNQRVAKFEPKIDSRVGFLYCQLSREESEYFIVNTAQGSAQPNISASSILSMPLIIPSENLVFYFNSFVDSNFSKIIRNRKENIALTQLRDTLLPKLISGELRLDEITSP